MGLDGIQNLKQLNEVLQNALDQVNAGDESPIEIEYASRKFKLNINSAESPTIVKMKDIIDKFKELADSKDPDKSLISDIHDRIVLLDLQGDITLKNKGSTFLRNILNMRFLTSSHLDDVDAIQKKHIFKKNVRDKASKIESKYTTNQLSDIGKKTAIWDDLTILGILKDDKEFEVTKNALRYLAVNNPKLAYKIIKDIHPYLEGPEAKELNPQYVQSLKTLFRNLDIELSVRPEYRDATVQHGTKTRNMVQIRALRELYEKDPENFRENFQNQNFLPGIDKEKLLTQLTEKYPNASRVILHALEPSSEKTTDNSKKPTDKLDKLRTHLLNRIENNQIAPQKLNRTITVNDPTSLDNAITNLLSLDKGSKITLNEYRVPEIIFSGKKEELEKIKKQITEKYNYIPLPVEMELSDGKLVIKNELLTYLLAPKNQHDQMNLLMYDHLWRNANDDIPLKQQILLGAIGNLGTEDFKNLLITSKITYKVLEKLSDKKLNLLTELRNQKPEILKDTFFWKQLAIVELQTSDAINPFMEVIKEALSTTNSSVFFNSNYKNPQIIFRKPVYDNIKEILDNSEFTTVFKGDDLILDSVSVIQLLIPAVYPNYEQMIKMMFLKAYKENEYEKNEIVSAAINNLKSDEELVSFFREAGIKASSLTPTLKQKLEAQKSIKNPNENMWDILVSSLNKSQ